MVSGPRRVRGSLAILFIGVLLMPGLAQAYLDPGTGSYVLQIVIGALLGGLFAIGIFWKRVLAFIRRVFSRSGDKDAGAGS